MQTQDIKRAVNIIIAHIDNGDPVEADSQLEIVLGPTNEHPDDVRRLLHKAHEEVSTGDPDIALLHLHQVLESLNGSSYLVATEILWRPERCANNDGNTNADRAHLAQETLRWFKSGGVPDAETVTDLLTNLLHYCQRESLDFSSILSTARGHYLNER